MATKSTQANGAPVFRRDLRKSPSETLRIERKTFKGHDLVDVRYWYKADGADGSELRAWRKGVTFRVALLPEVVAALEEVQVQGDDGESDQEEVNEGQWGARGRPF